MTAHEEALNRQAIRIKDAIQTTQLEVCCFSPGKVDEQGNFDPLIVGFDGEFDLRALAGALFGGGL